MTYRYSDTVTENQTRDACDGRTAAITDRAYFLWARA